MPYDIYGEQLRRGHCEVHPWVHEDYPCSCCYSDHQQRYERERELQHEHEHEMEREYIAAVEQQAIEDDVFGDGCDPGVI